MVRISRSPESAVAGVAALVVVADPARPGAGAPPPAATVSIKVDNGIVWADYRDDWRRRIEPPSRVDDVLRRRRLRRYVGHDRCIRLLSYVAPPDQSKVGSGSLSAAPARSPHRRTWLRRR